jgi:hypothetical protein
MTLLFLIANSLNGLVRQQQTAALATLDYDFGRMRTRLLRRSVFLITSSSGLSQRRALGAGSDKT